MLAIMRALDEWRSFLIRTRRPFEIHTDHRNLTYFRDPQKLTSRQANWTTKLQDYDFVIKYISGKSNVSADVLSRPDGEEKSERWVDVLLPERLFVNFLARRNVEQTEEVDEDNKGKVISESHDTPVAGHPGVKRTLSLLTRRGHRWKGMWRDVISYVKGCQTCQKNKPRVGPVGLELHPL
jgi:hypothetical protein